MNASRGQPSGSSNTPERIKMDRQGDLTLEFAQEVLWSVTVAILRLDLQGRIQYANPYFEHLSGWSLVEIRGNDWFAHFLPVRDRIRLRELFLAIRDDLPTAGSRSALVIRNGEEREMEWIGQAIRASEGQAEALLIIGNDIATRPSVETGFRQARHQFEAILRAIPDLVIEVDPAGRIVDFCVKVEELLHASPRHFLGRTLAELLTPEAGEACAETLRRAKEKGIGQGAPFRLMLADGERWFDTSASQKNWESHNTTYILLLRDITPRVRAEQQVRDSELRMKSILDNMFGFVGLYSLDGILLEANRAPLAAANLNRDDVIGKPFWEAYWWSWSPKSQEIVRNALHRAAQGQSVRGDFLVRVGENRFITIDATFSPIFDEAGRVVQLSGFGVDISDRKGAEQRLRESEERLRKLVDGSPYGIHELDQEGRFVSMNPAGLRMLERADVSGIIDRPYLDQVSAVDRPRIVALFEAARQGGRSDFEFVAVNGRTYSSNFIPLHLGGIMGITIDVTERESATRALRRSEEQLRLALKAAGQGLWDLDMTTGDAQVSPEYALMLGYDPATFQESYLRWAERLHPEDRQQVYAMYEKYVRGEIPSYEAEFRQRTRSGDWLWTLCIGSIVARDACEAPLRMLGTHTNISHLKQAEKNLRDSEARLREAQRIAQVGSWELDLTTMGLVWSDEIFRICEVERTQFGASYQAFLNTVHPDDRDTVNTSYTNSVETRQPYNVVHRLLMADGRVKFVRERCETYYDAAGQPLRSAGTVQDITERILAREALLYTRRQLLEAERLGKLGFLDWDLSTNVLTLSRETLRILDLEPNHQITTPELVFALVHPDDRAAVEEGLSRAIAGGPKHQSEHRMLRADGGLVHVHAVAEKLVNQDSPDRLFGIILDITDRRLAETQRQQNDAKLRLVLDNIDEAFFIMDRDWRYVDMNRKGAEMVGLLPEQLLGQSFLDMFPEAAGSVLEQAYKRVMETGESAYLEERYEPLDLWFVARIHRVPDGVAVFVNNITEWKKLLAERETTDKQLIRLREELIHLCRVSAVGELAAGIAHELNQPLAALANYAFAIRSTLEQIPAGDDGRLKAMLPLTRKLEDQAIRGGDIIRRLQRIIRKRTPVQSRVSVESLVSDVAELLASELRSAQIKLEVTIPDSLPQVRVDPVQIQQVLFNLCRNSLEAMTRQSDQRQLTIAACRQGTAWVEVRVRDWGPGIPPELAAELFTPFVTSKEGGLGLGLAISRRIVETHGGQLWMTPDMTPGVEFCFSLPIMPDTPDHGV